MKEERLKSFKGKDMLNYEEMLAVVDRATQTVANADGSKFTFTNIVTIRNELWYNWCFNAVQIEQSIDSMRRQGLLVDYAEGANN
tara:strand:- start:6899 stop:7153 length:255 start_codon:yes stop_codon:yes gene_type:complete